MSDTKTGAARPMRAGRGQGLKGTAQVPGDKSISHRALMFALGAVGETRIEGLLEGADVLATARIIGQLGAIVTRDAAGSWRVSGRGIGTLAQPDDILDFENSGTSARLLMGLMATHPISVHLTGDASLRKRPMERVLKPLRLFGAQAFTREGRLPIYLQGTAHPVPIAYELPVASAQVKSAILLAALNTPGVTTVSEPIATRDHTERMLRAFGAEIDVEAKEGGATIIRITGQGELKPAAIHVPRDPSSAAFLAVAATITPDSRVEIPGVLMNPSRTGLFTTLLEMGADLSFTDEREVAGERIATLCVRSAELKGVDVPAFRAPSMIDEYPVLAVAAAFAKGRTRMAGLDELRVKESDRLAAIAAGLRANGIVAVEGEASLEVEGLGPDGVPGGGTVETHMDHRIAMSFLVMGQAARQAVTVDDSAMIETSFPGFADLMRALGGTIQLPNIG